MKFSKHYEDVYRNLPGTWPLFINYKILKKSIRKIVDELEAKGFLINIDDPENFTVRDVSRDGSSTVCDAPLMEANYVIKGPIDELRPAIELSVLEERRRGDGVNDKEDARGGAFSGDNDKAEASPSSEQSSPSLNLSRRWTYHTITTAREHAASVNQQSAQGSADTRGDLAPAAISRRDLPCSSTTHCSLARNRDAPRTCTSTSPPEISGQSFDLAKTLLAPLNPETQPHYTPNEVRVVVPIEKKIMVRRPVLMRYLSFDSIAHRRVNLRQEYPSESSDAKRGRLLLELDLESDIKFLQDLYYALTKVAEFESEYSISTLERARNLLNQILTVGSPFGGDLKHWKWIFSLYVDCEIWFKRSGSARLSEASKECLYSFEKISAERKKLFKRRESVEVYEDFLCLNRDLLSARCFDEINATAIRKILKKHDRRTKLQASPTFMSLIKDTNSFPLDVIRGLIFSINESFTTIIPLPFNYSCPVCQELYWRPIRLICNHVFCVRCLAKCQVKGLSDCPLCRYKDAVATACDRNYDKALANFLKLYFPKEVREKSKVAKKEKAEEESKMIKLSIIKKVQT